ncbi:YHS domain protein [Nisaea acidiphila]|uniref:YHS domain protein n=1 Tax=Nisaea acidiphila TaxID=1862145 RepID=A0A9J7AKR4_9PROT|nr:YHS domain-containing (seleno)protein [Nisaea acidiphila]UUX48243.1 YHS domain protein [Nisaea acidiphila]
MSYKSGLSRLFLVIAAVGLVAAVAREPQTKEHIALVDPSVSIRDGFAIDGYDPVAYFSDHKAVRGNETLAVEFNGARFLFANRENRDRFLTDPRHFLPQFGGFSTYGVAKGKLYAADPEVFDIIDGRLYLSRNEKVRDLWQRNPAGYIDLAENNWRDIQAR